MKKTLSALILSVSMSSPAHALEVVFDPTAFGLAIEGIAADAAGYAADGVAYAKDIEAYATDKIAYAKQEVAQFVDNNHYIATAASWAKQVQDMKAEYDQLVAEYEAMRGHYDVVRNFNEDSLVGFLPDDWQDAYDSVREDGVAGLGDVALGIYEANSVYDACPGEIEIEGEETAAQTAMKLQRMLCQSKAVKSAQDKGFAVTGLAAARNKVGQINALMGEISRAVDPKHIQDLQARIAIENASLQNEQIKLKLQDMIAKSEDKLMEQQQKELYVELSQRDIENPFDEPYAISAYGAGNADE